MLSRPAIQRCLPLVAVLLILIVSLLLVGSRSFTHNDRHLVYTLDDAYIHMALAKNLSQHGVYGITRHGFTWCSSSPLWTLLLTASFKAFGVRDWIPALWAALFAAGSLMAADSLCRRFALGSVSRITTGLLILYLTPLLPLVSTGMEHSLHTCLTLWLLLLAVRVLQPDNGGERKDVFWLCVCVSLASAARFEAMSVSGSLAVLLFLRKRFGVGVLVAVFAVLPILVQGFLAVMHGGLILPSSLVLKRYPHSFEGARSIVYALGYRGIRHLICNPHLYIPCVLLLLTPLLARGSKSSLHWLGFVVCAAILAHLNFAAVGSLFRYEAYLVAAGVLLLAVQWLPRVHLPSLRSMTVPAYVGVGILAGIALLIWPLHMRAKHAHALIVRASRNIYEQQYQMGHFIRDQLEASACVAVNDIGAVSYYTDHDILDLWGLATVEITRAKWRGNFGTRLLAEILDSHSADYLAVYTDWFEGAESLPDHLIPVGRWSIRHNVVCGGRTVTFLGTSNQAAKRLQAALDAYAPRLPKSVQVERLEITE